MRGWLVDTNVFSELRKRDCNPAVEAWLEQQADESIFVSDVTIAEIRFGIERAGNPARRDELQAWLAAELLPWLADRVLPISQAVLVRWPRLVTAGRARGHTFPQPEAFLAATAAEHDLTLVTRNVADFRLAGVPVLNPWTGELLAATSL